MELKLCLGVFLGIPGFLTKRITTNWPCHEASRQQAGYSQKSCITIHAATAAHSHETSAINNVVKAIHNVVTRAMKYQSATYLRVAENSVQAQITQELRGKAPTVRQCNH
eukprot:754119-Amphidinium_carterae.2